VGPGLGDHGAVGGGVKVGDRGGEDGEGRQEGAALGAPHPRRGPAIGGRRGVSARGHAPVHHDGGGRRLKYGPRAEGSVLPRTVSIIRDASEFRPPLSDAAWIRSAARGRGPGSRHQEVAVDVVEQTIRHRCRHAVGLQEHCGPGHRPSAHRPTLPAEV